MRTDIKQTYVRIGRNIRQVCNLNTPLFLVEIGNCYSYPKWQSGGLTLLLRCHEMDE